jgi:hypothetical protein
MTCRIQSRPEWSGVSQDVCSWRDNSELPGNLNCPHFQSFSFNNSRPAGRELTVSHHSQFRDQVQMVFQASAATTSQLPTNVMNLVDLTAQLVKTMYWVPDTRMCTLVPPLLFRLVISRSDSR